MIYTICTPGSNVNRLNSIRNPHPLANQAIILDVFVKSRKSTTNVVPAKAGIQKCQMV